MHRGEYRVCNPPRNMNKNPTWKSFICTILVITVICILLLLIVSSIKKSASKTNPNDEHDTSRFHGDDFYNVNPTQEPEKKFDRIIIYDATESYREQLDYESGKTSNPEIIEPYHHHVHQYGENIDPETNSNQSEILQQPFYGDDDNGQNGQNASEFHQSPIQTSEQSTENSLHSTENSVHSTENSIYSTENSIHSTENNIQSTKNTIHSTENSIHSTEGEKQHPNETSVVFHKTIQVFQGDTSTEVSKSYFFVTSKGDEKVETLCTNPIQCDTKECIKASSKILSVIDFDKDPCENFYSYSCGGIDNHRFANINPKSEAWRRIRDMTDNIPPQKKDYRKHFKTVYNSCVNFDPNLIRNILQMANIPFRSNDSTEAIPLFNETISNLLKRNFAPFFDIQVDIRADSQGFHLTLIPGSLDGIFQKTLKETDSCTNCNQKHVDYIQSINETLQNLKIFDSDSQQLQEILSCVRDNLLPALENFRPSEAEVNLAFLRRNSTFMTLQQLEKELPMISWDLLFKSLYVECTEDTPIEVYFLDNLIQIFSSLKSIDERTLENSMMAMYTQKLYRDFIFDTSKTCNKEDFCLKLTSNLLPEIATVLYIDSFSKKEIKENDIFIRDIYDQVLVTLKADLTAQNWFSETPTEFTLKKLDNITLLTVGISPPWSNRQFLEDRMNNIVTYEENFIVNVIELEKNRRLQTMNLFNADPKLPENTWSFFTMPFEIAPIKIPELDRIVFPLAYTMDTNLNADYPKYIQMSETGFKIAKILIQYLQIAGVKLFQDNNIERNQYMEIAYMPTNNEKSFNFTVDTNILENEQIIDFFSTKLAYLSYTKMIEKSEIPLLWLNKTVDQLFFINLGQQFCAKSSEFTKSLPLPQPIQVNGILATFQDFKNIFSCQTDTKMDSFVDLIPKNIESIDDYEDSMTFVTDTPPI